MPKEGSHSICLLVVLIDSVFKMGQNYYPRVFLDECKCIAKEKEETRHVTEDLEIFSDSDESGEE